MKTWSAALHDGIISGSLASLASTLVLGARGKREDGSSYAPINAISHWFWEEPAAHQDGLSARYTLPGYAIHHASSTLWAIIYEKFFDPDPRRDAVVSALAGGAAVAGLACFCDYKLTPQRLQPGFEKRLSTGSLFLVYGSFGLGLALRSLARRHEGPNK